jgi:hypothetical protein
MKNLRIPALREWRQNSALEQLNNHKLTFLFDVLQHDNISI